MSPEKASYKTPRETIHMLADIVSKGGNLLLNIAPGPRGNWHPQAYELLAQIGEWMDVNSEAIYGSRAIAPFKDGNVCLTQNKDNHTVYAVYLAGEGENSPPPRVSLGSIQPAGNAKITMLGVQGKLKWERAEEGFVVEVPEEAQESPPCDHAWVFKIDRVE